MHCPLACLPSCLPALLPACSRQKCSEEDLVSLPELQARWVPGVPRFYLLLPAAICCLHEDTCRCLPPAAACHLLLLPRTRFCVCTMLPAACRHLCRLRWRQALQPWQPRLSQSRQCARRSHLLPSLVTTQPSYSCCPALPCHHPIPGPARCPAPVSSRLALSFLQD